MNNRTPEARIRPATKQPAAARRVRFHRDVWGRLVTMPQPLVAALHGYVLGSGIEIALGEEPDHAAMIIARGAILYRLLTGRMPYAEPGVRRTQLQVLDEVRERPPAPVESLARFLL